MVTTERFKRGYVAPDGRVIRFYAKNNGKEYAYWFDSADDYENWKARERTLESARYLDPNTREKKKAASRDPKARARKNELRRTPEAREARRARRKEDTLWALKDRLRTRCYLALRTAGYGKDTSTEKLLGAPWTVIKERLESLFEEGMSWENRSEWHIDHIVPLASASSKEELYRLLHYTNLQPLWAVDNLRKGAKVTNTN